MPRRPKPPTLRLAAIKAVGRWRWKILDFFSILISRHLERICYGCKNSHEVKPFKRNMHQFSNYSNKILIHKLPQYNFKKFRPFCSLRATPSWGRRVPLSPSHHPCLKICCKRCYAFMSLYLRLPLYFSLYLSLSKCFCFYLEVFVKVFLFLFGNVKHLLR